MYFWLLMRTPFFLTKYRIKISLLLLAIVISSCNTLKRVEDDELLLTKNQILADEKKVSNEDIYSLIIQKPNSNILGYPLRLNLYNLAKKNPDSSYQNWLHKKEKREQRLINFLSKKQVDKLGESFLVKGSSEWLKKIGEAPAIIDTSKTKKTLDRLKAYYASKGYFNNSGTYTITPSKRKKRAAIDYKITLEKPYTIDTLSKKISSKAIDSIYNIHKDDSYIKAKNQFDLSDFNNERERLTNIYRNSGIYNFQESSITYNILRDTSKAKNDQKMDVELKIDNLKKRGDTTTQASSVAYKVHRFKKINIYADHLFTNSKDSLKSVDYKNYTIYYKNKLRYKPKALTNAIFLEKDSIYRDIDRIRTNRQITNLNTFKYPSIQFTPDSTDTQLTTDIFLAARPKYSFAIDTDVTHSSIQNVGLAFSSSLITRNVFGGAETLSISARGSFGIFGGEANDKNISEVGADVNLTFPRIWLPLINTKKIIPYYMLPETRIAMGTSFQKNIGLDKQTFNTTFGYNWSPSNRKKHSLELLNIQFVRNVNVNRFFNVYKNTYNRLDAIANDFDQESDFSDPDQYNRVVNFFNNTDNPDDPNLIIPDGADGFINEILNNNLVLANSEIYNNTRSINERKNRLTENNLIFTSNYTFSINNKKDINDNDFYQFRFKVESAGNLLSAVSKIATLEKNDNDNALIFGVPYSQYIKTEFDYIKHWNLSNSNVLAFRSFLGIAIPYGNSENIPFTRSYFAGGSNDNRAWNPYSLGPGTTNAVNDFNEANLKIALNLEYRFPIVGNFKGALFADAGNIWNVYDDTDDPDAIFKGIGSLADLALGTGLGLRYDFTYFVFRLDYGFKTYNPAEEASKKWFNDYFANGVVQIGINYPF